jgi:hypothetical protein
MKLDEEKLALALVLGGVAGLIWHMAYLAAPMVDDAATTVSYGLTVFHGGGLRLTPASQEVEGFSNPLWVLLSGLSVPLHLDGPRFTQRLGQALGCLALLAFALWGPLAGGRRLRLEDAGVVLAAAVPSYAYWCASGMETGLEAFLLGVSGLLLLWELRRGEGSYVGLALALLCLTRPEGVLFAACAAGLFVAVRLRARKWPGRQEFEIASWLILVFGGYLVFRRLYFSVWLPNTYFAKLGWDFSVGQYVTGFLTAHAPLVAAGLLGALLGLTVGATRLRAALVLLWVGAGGFFIWHAHGDWMREWRFFAPLVPLWGAGLSAGLEAFLAFPIGRLRPWANAAVAVLVLAVGIAGLAKARERSRDLKSNPEFHIAWTVPAHEGALRAIARFGTRHPVVAIADIGGGGLVWREADVVDDAGLADYAMAHHAGNMPAQEDYLLGQAPLLVDAHGPSGFVRDLPRFIRDYVPANGLTPELRSWGGLMVLRGVTDREDPRCPGGKRAVLGLDPKALSSRIESLAPNDPAGARRLWRCAFGYQPEENLPPLTWRRQVARESKRRGDALRHDKRWRDALDQYELGSSLSGGDSHFRVLAEDMRGLLFPRKVGK